MSSRTLPLQRGIVYGPVHSRRLGLSLGINLFPAGHKICPFNCVYCEYGQTTELVARAEQTAMPSAAEVLATVEASLQVIEGLAYITFSGHGEPTLHPHFAEVVEGVVGLRDRFQPQAKVAVLSCSGVVTRPEVRAALGLLDERIMKLDAGDEATFRAINRPVPYLSLESIVDGLAQLEDVVIQHMVLGGAFSNLDGTEHEAWLRALQRVHPAAIQLYSVDRPTAESNVERVPGETMRHLAAEVEARTGIPTSAY
jgi:wyosine [tRNA(Phe)-imidazoG37] synthetase (radical SAM superfamily)